jgi:hypothetical protein
VRQLNLLSATGRCSRSPENEKCESLALHPPLSHVQFAKRLQRVPKPALSLAKALAKQINLVSLISCFLPNPPRLNNSHPALREGA